MLRHLMGVVRLQDTTVVKSNVVVEVARRAVLLA